MYFIKLIQVPNQSFIINIDGNRYTFAIRTFRGVTFMSLYLESELVIGGMRCIANEPIFPGGIAKRLKGNLRFHCLTQDMPHYTNFNESTCALMYEPIEG